MSPADVPLRTTSFTLEDRWLLWPRVRLYANRVELTGWSLSGRYHRAIPLDRIVEVESADDSLVLHLTDGFSFRIGMDAPRQWASAIETYRDFREVTE